jgi:hypothetical protein
MAAPQKTPSCSSGHALRPHPKRLRLITQQQQPAGSPHPLVTFLGNCCKQELAVCLLRGVQDLLLYVRGLAACCRVYG